MTKKTDLMPPTSSMNLMTKGNCNFQCCVLSSITVMSFLLILGSKKDHRI